MQNNDLISRGELLEKLRTFEKSTEYVGNVDIAIGYSHAQTITKEAPTVDAVPVVRCGECKMYRFTKGRDMCARNAVVVDGHEVGLSAVKSKDWYCADAVQMAPVKIERYDNGQGRCPLCKTDIPFQVVNDKWAFELYCPHCGAKMDLEDDAK